MPFLLRNLTLNPGEGEDLLLEKLVTKFTLRRDQIVSWWVVRKGIDARKKPRVKIVYTIEFTLADEATFRQLHGLDADLEPVPETAELCFPRLGSTKRIVIAGFGPAGLFAALRLSEYGLAPVVIERGAPMAERVQDVQAFWSRGMLDGESNVQFGEGGAGTFSDGKLTTRVRDGNIGYVLAIEWDNLSEGAEQEFS